MGMNSLRPIPISLPIIPLPLRLLVVRFPLSKFGFIAFAKAPLLSLFASVAFSAHATLATAFGAPAVKPRVVVQVISPCRNGSMPNA